MHTIFRNLPGMLLLLLVLSCSHDVLPEVPEFETLGFADSSVVVRRQVQDVYREWQEKPLDADHNGILGMHLSVYKKYASAEILYRRARALAPDEFRWTYYLAFTLVDLGRLEEAAAMFREALKIEPGYVPARVQLASLLWQMSDAEESGRLYKSLTEKFPDRIEGWFGLGRVYNRNGDNDAAVEALKRARKLGPQIAEVRYALAMVYREIGDQDAAEREFSAYGYASEKKIVTQDRMLRKIKALVGGVERHMTIGNSLISRGKYKKAAEAYRAALEAEPLYTLAWDRLVSLYLMLGEYEVADDVYREALAAGIDNARFHNSYGVAMLNAGRLDAARAALEKAVEMAPQYADALSNMGMLEMRSGAYVSSVSHYRSSLAARPNDRRTRFALAQALNKAGQFDEAVVQLESLTVESGFDRTLTLNELAIAYHGVGNKGRAIDTLRLAREAALKTNKKNMLKKFDRQIKEWQ